MLFWLKSIILVDYFIFSLVDTAHEFDIMKNHIVSPVVPHF